MNDIVIKAVAVALRNVPEANGEFLFAFFFNKVYPCNFKHIIRKKEIFASGCFSTHLFLFSVSHLYGELCAVLSTI